MGDAPLSNGTTPAGPRIQHLSASAAASTILLITSCRCSAIPSTGLLQCRFGSCSHPSLPTAACRQV
eukprot:2024204-Prymnesium_polylepis.2